MPQTFDHVLMFMLFAVIPLYVFFDTKRYVRRIKQGEPEQLLHVYLETAVLQWAAFAVIAGWWLYANRSWSSLGFSPIAGTGFWIAAGLVLAVSVYLLFAWQQTKALSAHAKQKHIDAIGDTRFFLPRDVNHLPHFWGMSLTAGIVEELAYRGFALWYLGHFMPIWAAVLVSSAAFGIGHGYQGASGMIRVTAVGLVFGGLYVLSGSIWMPMLGHILLDALQGMSIVEILGSDADADEPSAG